MYSQKKRADFGEFVPENVAAPANMTHSSNS